MARLEAFQAIGNGHAQVLRDRAGITTLSGLLKAAARPEGRLQLAQATGLDLDLILTWINFADLLRVKGVGAEYAHLLHTVGITNILKLQTETPENLFENIHMVNKSRHFVRRLPTVDMIADWIEQAKELPPCVET